MKTFDELKSEKLKNILLYLKLIEIINLETLPSYNNKIFLF